MARGGGLDGNGRRSNGRAAAPALGRVMRAAVVVFFSGYHCFSPVAAMLAVPFSAAVLGSQAMASGGGAAVLRGVSARVRVLFLAPGFPPSAFFVLLNAKLSQTVFTFAATLPFALTFLLVAKACVAGMLRPDATEVEQERGGRRRRRRRSLPTFASVAGAYPALVATHLFSSFAVLSANAAVFSLLFLAFAAADQLGGLTTSTDVALSAAGATAYSIAIGVATVVCNLALVVSAMERRAGHAAVLRACVMIRGSVPTALALAVPTKLGMAATEALFQLRVVSCSRRAGRRLTPGVAGEAFSIAYMHALCVVLEIIVSCMFYRSCKRSESDELREPEPEKKGDLQA